VLFRRRQRRGFLQPSQQSDAAGVDERQQLYRIDFDMMLKGSICKRRRVTVRQFGVTVNGSTRLVTSGDTVDRDTYNALLAVEAIRPSKSEHSADLPKMSCVDFTAVERFEE
jgi:hypothetical protein